jgi:UrcA family protein
MPLCSHRENSPASGSIRSDIARALGQSLGIVCLSLQYRTARVGGVKKLLRNGVPDRSSVCTATYLGDAMTIAGRILAAAAVSVLSFGSAAAYADPATSSLTVRIADLNLNQPRDIARLYTRISSAADKMCGPRSVGGFNLTSSDYLSCYSDAVAQAVAHLDRPAVTAYYRERSAEPGAREAKLVQD